ncbi:MAG: ACT domain-containing protein [Candidatus Acidiferrum sp.]
MPVTARKLTLSVLSKTFVICKLPADAPVPAWATQGKLFSITRTSDELSVVAEKGMVPENLRGDTTWRAMKAHGPFAFSEVGVLAALVAPLAEAGISVFALSTFDTDYLFTGETHLQAAVAALCKAGHTIHEA